MKKVVFSIVGIVFYITLIMQMNINPRNSLILISLDNIEALADGETPGTGVEKVQCVTGQKSLNTAYSAQRWCGDCKMYRIIQTGDGHCSKML